MYSIHKEGKSVIAERFIRILKNKIYKYITLISKNVYIDKYIANKYNNTYHKIIKMKHGDVKPSIYIDFNKENNNKGPNVKVGDNVRISKCENIFAKGYVSNWSEELFVIKKVKKDFVADILLVVLTEKKLLEHFAKKNCKKQTKKSLELKK